MTIKPLIILYDAGGLGLIVQLPSGVLYTNQVGGYSCRQPQAEGIYVPLVDEVVNQEEQLYTYFTGPKLLGGCANGIDLEDADAIPSCMIDYSRHSSAWIEANLKSPAKPGSTSQLQTNPLNDL